MHPLPTALLTVAAAIVSLNPLPAAEPPPLADCEAALLRAVTFFHDKVAIEGGYAFERPVDLSYAEAEHAKGTTIISIQPPGTTTVGLTMLEAYQATGDKRCLDAARHAAEALIRCQLASGGWPAEFDFRPEEAKKYHLRSDFEKGDTETGKRRNLSTLDDNKTQSALLFLLELAHDPSMGDDAALKHTLGVGLDALIAAQATNGGWPQQFDGPADPNLPVVQASCPDEWPRTWPNEKYYRFYTLNDDNHLHCLEVLIRAHELTRDERFLQAAKKAGDFLRLARLPDPQPVWAQQYDEQMHPVWARKFEPPAASSAESYGALEALVKLWIATGDAGYVEGLEPAIAWFEKSRLPDGQWARFYELKTNRPLYCKRDTYEITYDDSDLPTHYGFNIGDTVGKKVERLRERIADGLDKARRDQAGPQTPGQWEKEARSVATPARKAIETLDDQGRWVSDGTIDTTDFIKNARALARCILAQKNARE